MLQSNFFLKKIIFLLLLSTHLLSLGMIQTLKDTYTILPADKKYMSVTNGAILWETTWINNFHRFSNDYPSETTDRRGRSIIGYDKDKTDGLKKLVYTLFYRVPGSASFTDFSTTDFIQAKDPVVIANLVGQIILVLDAIQAQKELPYKDTANKLLALVKKVLILSETKYLKISGSNFVAANLQALQLVHEGTYPAHLVQSVWLAFLYKALDKLCGTDLTKNRLALAEYYKTLGTALKLPLSLNPEDNFPTTLTPTEAQKQLELLVSNNNGGHTTLDNLLFYTIKSKTFPALSGYINVDYKPTPSSKAVSFPDCMENSIANFIRIMSYDISSGNHTIQTLEQRFNITISDQARIRLEPFLKNVHDHNLWANLVSNIVCVPYVQSTQHQPMNNPRFIRLENLEDKSNYEAAGYHVVDAKDATFELQASLRTLIIMLNYILDLKLFSNNLAAEALRKDFVAHYFPLLCKKLHVEGEFSNSAIETESDDDQEKQEQKEPKSFDIDMLDFTGHTDVYALLKNNFSDLSNNNGFHSFKTSVKHGEYAFSYKETTKFINNLINPLKKNSTDSIGLEYSLIIANLFYNNLSSMYALKDNQKTINPYFNANTVFALPLYNGDYVLDNFVAWHPGSSFIRDDISLLYNLVMHSPDSSTRYILSKLWIESYHNDTDRENHLKGIKQRIINILQDPFSLQDSIEEAFLLLNQLQDYKLFDTDKDLLLNFNKFKIQGDYTVFAISLITMLKELNHIENLDSIVMLIIKQLFSSLKNNVHESKAIAHNITDFIQEHSAPAIIKEYPKNFFKHLSTYLDTIQNSAETAVSNYKDGDYLLRVNCIFEHPENFFNPVVLQEKMIQGEVRSELENGASLTIYKVSISKEAFAKFIKLSPSQNDINLILENGIKNYLDVDNNRFEVVVDNKATIDIEHNKKFISMALRGLVIDRNNPKKIVDLPALLKNIGALTMSYAELALFDNTTDAQDTLALKGPIYSKDHYNLVSKKLILHIYRKEDKKEYYKLPSIDLF